MPGRPGSWTGGQAPWPLEAGSGEVGSRVGSGIGAGRGKWRGRGSCGGRPDLGQGEVLHCWPVGWVGRRGQGGPQGAGRQVAAGLC